VRSFFPMFAIFFLRETFAHFDDGIVKLFSLVCLHGFRWHGRNSDVSQECLVERIWQLEISSEKLTEVRIKKKSHK
jgi:hypothetical protein